MMNRQEVSVTVDLSVSPSRVSVQFDAMIMEIEMVVEHMGTQNYMHYMVKTTMDGTNVLEIFCTVPVYFETRF